MERGSPYSDSPLLSEIHTLFPALLYDSARFRTLQDVFRYVRERLRARYDVFSNAAREFQNSDPVVRSRANIITNSMVPVVAMNVVDSIGQIAVSDLIRSFLYSGTGAHNGNSGDPVAASQIPTNEQIERASQDFPYTGAETSCAICQDSIRLNEVVRRITACDHTFHEGCLSTWFRRHATCPLCRNDIRVAGPATTTTIPPPLP
jgi:hypothetical protein